MTTTITIRQIDQAKAEGRFRYAGQLDALRGGDGHYGAHFGMRSTCDAAREEFRYGFDEVNFHLTHGDLDGDTSTRTTTQRDYAVAPNGQAFFPLHDTPLTLLADKGHTVKHAPAGVVVAHMWRQHDVYVMRNRKGSHRLAVACTDEARLAAHWEGFCETSRAISEGRVYRRGI